jgi:dipeptidyl aminopeptidase/acylaminoacyl peptidase
VAVVACADGHVDWVGRVPDDDRGSATTTTEWAPPTLRTAWTALDAEGAYLLASAQSPTTPPQAVLLRLGRDAGHLMVSERPVVPLVSAPGAHSGVKWKVLTTPGVPDAEALVLVPADASATGLRPLLVMPHGAWTFPDGVRGPGAQGAQGNKGAAGGPHSVAVSEFHAQGLAFAAAGYVVLYRAWLPGRGGPRQRVRNVRA